MTPSAASTASPQIDVWFEFGSTYSYLSVMRIEGLAAAHGVHVAWRPFLMGPIFKELGWQGSPFLEQKEKMAHMWVDMARQCAKYDLPWRQPSVFPRSGLLPLRVVMAWANEPWIGEFCRAVMLQNFAHDLDMGTAESVQQVLTALTLPVEDILAVAQSEFNRMALRRQTEQARALGIFGGPTFFVGDQMFWGNDRLEDALSWAARPRAV